MNSMIGKSTGIALLMAAAILAALFAMGTFSATGVGADAGHGGAESHTHAAFSAIQVYAVTPNENDPDAPTVGTTNIADTGNNGTTGLTDLMVKVPGTNLDVPDDAIRLRFSFTPSTASDTSESAIGTVTANFLDGETQRLSAVSGSGGTSFDAIITGKVLVSVTAVATDGTTGANSTQTLVDHNYTVDVNNNLATSKTTPDSNQSLVVDGMVAYETTGNITVDLKSFGVPSSIDPNHISIMTGSGSTASAAAKAADVEVDGTTVILVAPFTTAETTPSKLMVGPDSEGGLKNTTITFRRSAGIKLPIRHGYYDVKVTTSSTEDDSVKNWVSVEREVSVSPKSGKRGTEVTISGKGFADGTAEVKIGSHDAFTTANVSGGTFSVKVDTAAEVNDDNVFTSMKTMINVSDAVGASAAADATFEIKPSFTVSPDNPLSGADITITLEDITVPDGTKPMVTFAGDTANAEEATEKTSTTTILNDWTAGVPADVRIGTIQVKVTVGSTSMTQNITIGTNDLVINPTTVVPRQEVSIDGSGFTITDDSTTSDKMENSIASDALMFGDDAADHDVQLVDNSGNISFNVKVPDGVKPGTVKVSVKDEGGRAGVATITIAKPEIKLEPAESLIGSMVTVTGTGFPASDLVLISYGGTTVSTAPTSATGTFEQTITIPGGRNPGAMVKIEAKAQVQDITPVTDKASAMKNHTLPKTSISLSSATATAGQTIDISGANFLGYRQVSKISIGGQNVTPIPAPSTDQWGAFTANGIRVPQLTPGRYAVLVEVPSTGDNPSRATEFLQVTTAPVVVPTDPAEVFAGISDRLSRVWYLDRENQNWMFYDPDPDLTEFSDLDTVSSGQVVTIIITAGEPVEFQGMMLYPGSNPVALR